MNQDSIKFLVVDDTEQNIVALTALLRRDGLEVVTARSGAQALELLLIHDFALALLDVQMPEMDGFELAEFMRGTERTRHIPIIFVTAGARDPQRVFRGYTNGAVDFLFKPIDPHMLKSKTDVFFEVYRQRRELATSLRVNEMFVGILGHDLRNPLSAMLAGTELLERRTSDPTDQRVLKRMSAAGQRMTSMIEQLLDLTRARLGGGLGFLRVRRRIDIAELVQRTAEELRGTHAEREILVEVAGDCTSTGDADRLLQVFSNLIANALKHGAKGSPIRVSIQARSADISVSVNNRGSIAPDLLPTIFDPFRGRDNSTASSPGLGLGLFISQQIVAAHGGTLEVDSSELDGTTFTVQVPRRALASPRVQTLGRPKVILIADADESIRHSLGEAFTEEGYVVTLASSGPEALACLRGIQARPDVVVLDLGLPVVDGQHVYAAAQADKIPVVISTSTAAFTPAGAVVVPKPLNLDQLFDAVNGLWAES